jgi:hypothetical protein
MRVSVQLVVGDVRELGEMTHQPDLEQPVAMKGNRQA